MSYTLFLLLNVNHRQEDLFACLNEKLEPNGATSFCVDRAPDVFYSVEYLKEGNDTSLCIDIPFGAEGTIMREILDLMTHVQQRIQFQVFDPQMGRIVKEQEVPDLISQWQTTNLVALKNYSNGHYFLRSVEEREGSRTMIEATKYAEATWPNYCSVGLAFARAGEASLALNQFERALALDPGNPGLLYALGVTHFNLKDYNKAQQVLNEALVADPSNEAARGLLEDTHGKLNAH